MDEKFRSEQEKERKKETCVFVKKIIILQRENNKWQNDE